MDIGGVGRSQTPVEPEDAPGTESAGASTGPTHAARAAHATHGTGAQLSRIGFTAGPDYAQSFVRHFRDRRFHDSKIIDAIQNTESTDEYFFGFSAARRGPNDKWPALFLQFFKQHETHRQPTVSVTGADLSQFGSKPDEIRQAVEKAFNLAPGTLLNAHHPGNDWDAQARETLKMLTGLFKNDPNICLVAGTIDATDRGKKLPVRALGIVDARHGQVMAIDYHDHS